MTKFERNVAETAEALGITARQAIMLEFVNMATLAHIGQNTSAEAIAYAACAHVRGVISAEEMRICFSIIDRKAAA